MAPLTLVAASAATTGNGTDTVSTGKAGFTALWTNVATFLPKAAAFLIVIVLTWIVAKIVSRAVTKLLRRVGLDRMLARTPLAKPMSRSTTDPAGIVGKLASLLIWLFGLSLAFGFFGNNPISAYLTAAIAYLPKLLVGIAIVVVAAWLANVVRGLIRDTLGGLSYGETLAKTVGVVILAFGILAALHQLNIAPTIVNALVYATLAAVVGVVVVGVGGGLVRPMQQRWERALNRVESEAPQIRNQMQNRQNQRMSAVDPYPTEAPAPAPTRVTAAAPAEYGSAMGTAQPEPMQSPMQPPATAQTGIGGLTFDEPVEGSTASEGTRPPAEFDPPTEPYDVHRDGGL